MGLALGSGCTAGLAHIAIFQVFDDLERTPDHLAGTRIGAVIGALYASGLSAAQIRDIFDDVSGSSLDVLSGLVRPGSESSLRDVVTVDLDDGGTCGRCLVMPSERRPEEASLSVAGDGSPTIGGRDEGRGIGHEG